jgi:hypothetical protein
VPAPTTNSGECRVVHYVVRTAALRPLTAAPRPPGVSGVPSARLRNQQPLRPRCPHPPIGHLKRACQKMPESTWQDNQTSHRSRHGEHRNLVRKSLQKRWPMAREFFKLNLQMTRRGLRRCCTHFTTFRRRAVYCTRCVGVSVLTNLLLQSRPRGGPCRIP